VCRSADPEARAVAKLYTTVPESYRKLVPAEAYCYAAGVSPYRILEIITGSAVRFGAQASTVLASAMLPKVVQKTIDKAMQDEGTKERELVFRATGLIGR
jgi:hypothetical protein